MSAVATLPFLGPCTEKSFGEFPEPEEVVQVVKAALGQ
jgi:hypothetical protein